MALYLGIVDRSFMRKNPGWASTVRALEPSATCLEALGAIVAGAPSQQLSQFVATWFSGAPTYVKLTSSCVDDKTCKKPDPWHVEAVGAIDWHKHKDRYRGKGVKCGILDTGLGPHSGEFASTPSFRSYSASGPPISTTATDPIGHGTGTASLVGGAKSGIAPDATLYCARVASSSEVWPIPLAFSVDWCLKEGCRILVAAWQSDAGSVTATMEAATTAIGGGALVVAAIGNGGAGHGCTASPGNRSFALGAGAVDATGKLWRCSSSDPQHPSKPEIYAAGHRVVRATLDGKYGRRSGTSLSAAIVGGAAALVAQKFPTASPDQLREKLIGYSGTKRLLTLPHPDQA